MRPHGFPQISVKEGRIRFLPTLPLTGITGSLRPTQAGEDAVDVLFAGSYAGAKRSLWTATGKVKPAMANEPSDTQTTPLPTSRRRDTLL